MVTECKNCNQLFEINSDKNLKHKKEYRTMGQSIFLTYYDCPSCGSRHFVQIDDEISIRKLNDVKRQFVSLAVANKKGKEVTKKQTAKFKKTRKDLSVYRRKLMERFTNAVVHDYESKATYELKFLI